MNHQSELPGKSLKINLGVPLGIPAPRQQKWKRAIRRMEIVDANAVESIAGIDAKTGEVGRVNRDRFD